MCAATTRRRAASCSWRSPSLLLVLLVVLAGQEAGCSERHLVRRADKDSHHWNYEDKTGPTKWPEMYKQCGGRRQSPINIDLSDIDTNQDLNAFEFSNNYDDPMKDAYIENNGHTVVVNPGPSDVRRTFTEGGLDDTYEFVQLHFHWGSDSKKGSEHTIDGKQYPLELHLVHKNTNYKTMEAAKMREDGLAVLSVLFKITDDDNEALIPIIDKLDDVRKEGTKAELVDDFDIEALLPDDLMPYYRYEGSLTTPPCNEVVIWTIFEEFAEISEKQLELFRSVRESDEGEADEQLQDNFRPVQDINGRIIEISGNGAADGARRPFGPLVLLAAAGLVLLGLRPRAN